MPFFSGGHLWILVALLIIVLIIWGPGKLPDIGSGLGRAIREFRKASTHPEESAEATGAEAPAVCGTACLAIPGLGRTLGHVPNFAHSAGLAVRNGSNACAGLPVILATASLTTSISPVAMAA